MFSGSSKVLISWESWKAFPEVRNTRILTPLERVIHEIKRGSAEIPIHKLKIVLDKLTCITITYHEVNNVVDEHVLQAQRNDQEHM